MTKAILKIETADTPTARSFGLMYRKFLPENNGMLFIFEKPDILSFWGRNTYIPLDVAFVSDKDEIINIEEVPILSDDTVKSLKKAKYAIEANRGFFKNKDVKVGDEIEIVNNRVYFL